MKSLQVSIAAIAMAFSGSVFGANIFAPGDTIFGGASDGVNFNVGAVGTAAGVNNWPGAEAPTSAIDGVGQKYLNFAEVNTGFVITLSFNGGNGSIVTGIKLWTANDAVDRDPASYALYGSNEAFSGGGPFAMSSFTLISEGPLALPATRNAGGAAPLDDLNSQTVPFANSNAYSSYLLLFPTVKNAEGANSMQIAEVQLDGVVPEPGAIGLAALGAGLMFLRRRKRA